MANIAKCYSLHYGDTPIIFHGPIKYYDMETHEPFITYYIYNQIVSQEEWREHELITKLSGLEE